MKTVALVRAETLSGYAALASSYNLDARRLLRSVRLEKIDFTNRKLQIPGTALFELLEKSAKAGDIEDFGLRLSAARDFRQIGPIAHLLLEQPTLGHALKAAETYIQHYSEALGFRIEERGDIVSVHVGYNAASRGQTRQVIEYLLGEVFRTFKSLAGDAWSPDRALFMHPAPKSSTIHKSFFQTRLVFGSRFNGFVLKVSDLKARIRTAGPAAKPDERFTHVSINPRRSLAFEDKLKQIIFHLLPSGRCRSTVVAEHLGIDRTTINRRLQAKGETFSSVVNSVRAELVRRYLVTDQRTLTQTAELLGFSDIAVFSRWFRGEFKTTATAWRADPARM